MHATGHSLRKHGLVRVTALLWILIAPVAFASEAKPEDSSLGTRHNDFRPYTAALEGAWIRSDRWPNTLTPATFAADVFRLDRTRINCEEDKALALYRWQTRCYGRSGSPREGPKGMEGHFTDSWKQFHTYGQGLCDKWGRLGAVLAQGAGYKARKVTCIGHTMYEVLYKDRDGVERWHLFDPHVGTWVYARTGKYVASVADMVADPALMFNAPKVSDPFGSRATKAFTPRDPTPEEIRAKWRWYQSHVFSRVWPPKFDPRMNLPIGSTLTRYWHRAPDSLFYSGGKRRFNNNHCKLGWHDPTTRHYENGEVKDKENYPYWKPYLIDCRECNTKGAKPLGHAIFRWWPPLTAGWFDRDVLLSDNVATSVEPGKPLLHPARAREQAVLIYRVASPYVIADASVRARVWRTDKARTSEMAFLFSIDEGVTWHLLKNTRKVARAEPIEMNLELGKKRFEAGKASAHGKYAFLLRIDMLGKKDPRSVGLEDLEIEYLSQLNMFTLPFLRPGKNIVDLHARRTAPGTKVEAAFGWDDTSKKSRTARKTFEKLPGQFTVDVDGRNPDDVRMRFVRLAVPGPARPDRPVLRKDAPRKAPAANEIRVAASLLTSAPKMDGKLDEATWKKAGSIDALYDNTTRAVLEGETRTRLFIGRHDGRLYLAADCREPGFGPDSTISSLRDGNVWKDSSIELFICPSGAKGEYWRIAANAKGVVQDARHASAKQGNTSHNLDVKAAASATKAGWLIEMSVPLKEMGVDESRGSIGFNLFRNVWGDELGGGTPEEEQAVSPTGGSYHDRSQFATLDFKE